MMMDLVKKMGIGYLPELDETRGLVWPVMWKKATSVL
jgi:hypothetical protein